jgi:hypothetical protein
MRVIKLAAAVAVYAVLSSTAHAAADQPFSALEAVQAEALSSTEMKEVHGQLTVAQIKAAIVAKVADPRLQSFLLQQVDRAPANARTLLALIARGRYD